jgi:tetratricopeptide (TPR) repeat protein
VLRAAILLLAASTAAGASDDALRAGLMALQRGDLAGAQASLETASRETPRDGRVWVALSQTYWKLHRAGDADAAASRAAAVAPEDPAVLQGLAIYYSETGRTLQAAQAEARFAAKVPGNSEARARAAELYFAAAQPLLDGQKFGEAAAVLEEATARVRGNAQLELALGVAYYGLRRFDEAADAFLRTIEAAGPESAPPQPYTFLGKILDQIPGRLARVTEKFAAYQAAHPERAEAWLLHAKALDAQSLEPEKALGLIEKSIALDAGNAAAYFEKGTVLDRMERFADASAAYERAAQLAPGDAATHYRLARDYERMGKPEEAARERERHAELVKEQGGRRE